MDIDPTIYKHVVQVVELSANSIEVTLTSGGDVRITATRLLGGDSDFYALYEEQAQVADVDGQWRLVWVPDSQGYPSAYGKTVDECLRAAIGWLV